MKPSILDPPNSQPYDAACTAPPGIASSPTPSPRWATRLRRHLTWAFIAKLMLLALLYFLFFSSSQRLHIDAGRVADRFLSPG